MSLNTNRWNRLRYTFWAPFYDLVGWGFDGRRRESLRLLDPRPGERVLVVHNLGTAEAEAGPYTLLGAAAEPLFASAEIAAPVSGPEGWKVRLPAGASGVWVLTPR